MGHETMISATILSTALERGAQKSTCPSEIARMLFFDDWRLHMAEVRKVAILLQKQGKVLITQKGLPIDTDNFKGPVRIKIVKD
ncbi:MAG: DUF3253 domain-containing protein [Pedobacter sp.]|nr:MAG: DUF3253 domain-containing protein [Pedobacter sp.]